MKVKNNSISLFKWIWKAYLHTALIPLVLIELVFICIYFLANSWSQKETINYLRANSQSELLQIANQEAEVISQKVQNITNAADFYRKQTAKALLSPAAITPEDKARLTYSPDGVYYTNSDKADGGAAVFYSGIIPVGDIQREKVEKVLSLQNIMKDLKQSFPYAASIYLNTYDSLNIIYPYFDVMSQYTPRTDIATYNFYYEADTVHNPARKTKWTNAYLDPAGHGWVASAISPVYNGSFLEGVIGIDVPVSTISNNILQMKIPCDGYGLLISKDGTILALPEKGEKDWGISELTEHLYNEAIMQNTFKPDNFNLYKREGFDHLAERVLNNSSGLIDFTLNTDSKVISWATIADTGWKLLIVVPEKNIYEKVNAMSYNLLQIGAFMIAGLILFYSIFFFILYKTSHKVSLKISQPLLEINNMTHQIGQGNYYQTAPIFYVEEIKQTVFSIVDMGIQLGIANENLLATQNKLQKREDNLEALVNSIGDTIWEIDKNNIITHVWSKDKNNLAKEYDETKFICIEDLLDKESAQIATQKIKNVIENGASETLEYSLETNMGSRWFQARISCIANNSESVVVSARDITERKQMEQSILTSKIEAEKANKAKSQFLSNMSHELRTPLNAILGFSQILELDPDAPLNESQSQCVREITKAGNHLLQLINEILDLAKIESGKLTVSIEPVEVKPIIEETLALMKPLAEQYKVELVTSPPSSENVFVSADRTRIKQVLLNLLSNAVKYNKENGKVYFYYEKTNDIIRFSVVDTGVGLSENDLVKIFEPFYRLNSKNIMIEGTGIGLAVAKQMVELMRGKIIVKSEKGVGSNFSVELPFCNTAVHDDLYLPVSKNTHYIESNKRHKILYVEDDPANLKLVEHILTRIPSIELFSAVSGELSIDLARAHKPDLILLDINLPGIDGYEVFNRLRTYKETTNIPIVAVSANALPRDIEKSLSFGFKEYIVKPINVPDFLEKIFKLLNELT